MPDAAWAEGTDMIVEIASLIGKIEPSKTVLILGSGSSIPSGGKSGNQLAEILAERFNLSGCGYSLTEVSQIISDRDGRPHLIKALREFLSKLQPTGGMLNIPLYDWNGIYTTNYDQIIERAYERVSKPLRVVSSNFDFGKGRDDNSSRLFKVHGSIENDIVDGSVQRLIISDEDYELTSEYREMIWDRLRADLAENDCIIIGQSLEDQHLKELIAKIASMKQTAGHLTSTYLLLFDADPNRAALYSRRNITVSFGGIDDFFVELAKADQGTLDIEQPDSPFGDLHSLYPVTTLVADAIKRDTTLERMYNGWPASWADVAAGYTFQRESAYHAESDFADPDRVFATFLGASGTGKTTAARQCVFHLQKAGYFAWEHNADRELLVSEWSEVADRLHGNGQTGVLFVDDAHEHLSQLNQLADNLVSAGIGNLKFVLASARNDWNPRVKSPNLYKYGREFIFNSLSDAEVESLINLVERQPEVKRVVEYTFGSFSQSEKRRRLRHACDKNTFVCLRNIFANEAFDDIILREFAALQANLQDVYRTVAALESLNVRVHRQLVIRLTGVAAVSVPAILSGLTDIVEEYTIDRRQGVYGWRGRHKVITEIITKHKFYEQGAIYKLLERVIENLSMTYDVEVRTVRNLCTASGGLARAGNKTQQNKLLQKLISQAPGERIPRHRLIANLIAMGESSKAETEIRLFQNDFREDGPVARYRVKLLIYRAVRSKGILLEDRLAIIDEALNLAKRNLNRFAGNKYVLSSYCDVGVAHFKLTGSYSVFDKAIARLKEAEKELGDPDISKMIERYSRAVTLEAAEEVVFEDSPSDVD